MSFYQYVIYSWLRFIKWYQNSRQLWPQPPIWALNMAQNGIFSYKQHINPFKLYELVESCFEESSNLSDKERATLYYISGYVANEKKIGVSYERQGPVSEFTNLVSRGGLSHPPQELFDLSQYLYCFFKLKKPKCCSKIFLQAYDLIHEASGYEVESIYRRSLKA